MHARIIRKRFLAVLLITMILNNDYSTFIYGGPMKLYVSIRKVIKNDIINFVANKESYRIVGNFVLCNSLESKLNLMRFISFHDPSKMINEYVCIKYLSKNIIYDIVCQDPYYVLKKENWAKTVFLESDIKIELDKFTVVDHNEFIKYQNLNINDYFINCKLKDIYYKELRDNPSFIAAVLNNGYFVRKTDEDGSLVIFQ